MEQIKSTEKKTRELQRINEEIEELIYGANPELKMITNRWEALQARYTNFIDNILLHSPYLTREELLADRQRRNKEKIETAIRRQSLIIATDGSEVGISNEALQALSTEEIVKLVQYALHKGFLPSPEQYLALISKYFADENKKLWEIRDFYEASFNRMNIRVRIPQSEPIITYPDIPFKGPVPQTPENLPNFSQDPYYLTHIDSVIGSSDLENLIYNIFELYPLEVQIQSIKWLLEKNEEGFDVGSEIAAGIYLLVRHSKNSTELKQVIETYINAKKNFTSIDTPKPLVRINWNKGIIYASAPDVASYPSWKILEEYLETQNILMKTMPVEHILSVSDREMPSVIGQYIDEYGFVALANSMRAKLIDEGFNNMWLGLNQTGEYKLIRAMKTLLNIPPQNERIPIHPALQSVYDSINFSEYFVNNLSQEKDMAVIQQILHSRDSEYVADYADSLVDLGCGTGRLTRFLAQNHPRCIVTGIDINDENLSQAKKNSGELPNVHYKKGNWLNLPIADASQTTIICLGRSLTHTEDKKQFLDVFKEMSRILRIRGEIIFDLPDPNKGVYLTNRKRLIKHVKGLGAYSDKTEEELLQDWDIIVDGPDFEGTEEEPKYTHVYNRFTPQFEWVKQELAHLGFEVKEVDRNQIYANTSDENVYFVAVKKKDFNPPSLPQPTPTPTKLSE